MSAWEPVSRVCDWLGAAENPAFARDDKRSISMCDYSLHHVATRPAKIDDRLVTTKFRNSLTRGFAAVGDTGVAVCLMPGTELAFDRDVECERALPIFPT